MKNLYQFGQTLKQLREKAAPLPGKNRLTQEELAKKIQVITAYISHWENSSKPVGTKKTRSVDPQRHHMVALVKFFAEQNLLNQVKAMQWAGQAGYALTLEERQELFPAEISLNHEEMAYRFGREADLLLPLKFHDYWQYYSYEDTSMWLEAIAQAEQAGLWERQIELSIDLAKRYQHHSRLYEAIELYRQTIRQAEKCEYKYLAARAKNNLAYLYTETNAALWNSAAQMCCCALTLFEELNDRDKLAHAHNHMGILTMKQGDGVKAQFHLEQGRILFEQANDPYLKNSFVNLGTFYLEQQNYLEALNYFDKAAQLSQGVELGTSLMNMAIAYRRLNDLEQAESLALKAKEIFEQFHCLTGLAKLFGNLGLIYLNQNQWVETHLHLQASFQIWQKLNNSQGQAKAQSALVEWGQLRHKFVSKLVIR